MTQPLPPMAAADIRRLDRRAIHELKVPGVVLMENAGRGAAQLALELLHGSVGPALVLAGPGNNGGDGYVVARHLANAGVSVQVFLFAPEEKITGDARIHLDILRNLRLSVSSPALPDDLPALRTSFAAADLLVDALLGTGASGPVRSPIREVIDLINHAHRPVLALDIPSGLHADTGEILGAAVHADVTATFLCPKLGFYRNSGPRCTGRVVVVDIGVNPNLFPEPLEPGP